MMESKPSQTRDRFWIQAWQSDIDRIVGPRVGKWIVTIDERDIDAAWAVILQALNEGQLGPAAKTRTAQMHPVIEPDGKTVIVVYTADSLDVKDRNRVHRALTNLGFQDLRYKTDEETRRDWRMCIPNSQGDLQ
jgi:hypothetical protein